MKITVNRNNGKIETVDSRNMDDIYDAAWESVDEAVKERAIEVLRAAFSEDSMEKIRVGVDVHGRNGGWMSHSPFTPDASETEDYGFVVSWHHSVGMYVRNLLRQAGLTDDRLPKSAMDAYYGDGMGVQNWDDYYVAALEAAAGAR